PDIHTLSLPDALPISVVMEADGLSAALETRFACACSRIACWPLVAVCWSTSRGGQKTSRRWIKRVIHCRQGRLAGWALCAFALRSEEHTSELQSRGHL